VSDIREFESYAERVISGLYKILDRAKDIAEVEFEKEDKLGFAEFGALYKQKIENIYKKSVDDFYDAYTPKVYKRTHSLYDVLSVKTDENGMVISGDDIYGFGLSESGAHNLGLSFMDLFDESKMVTGRGGQSLFDTVFIGGYHGGAADISTSKEAVWGAHPQPGKPYYRRGGWVKYPGSTAKKWHRYGKWGRAAVKTKSIYQMMVVNLGAAESGEIFDDFKRIMDSHGDAAAKKVNDAIVELSKEIFG